MADIKLPESARAVIVGAGIAGCSVAYHLTKLGWRDVVVVDQGPLYETGGSTSHAPGLVFQINASKTMTNFASYTVDLWKRMELDGEPCANPVGSLEVAWTDERLYRPKTQGRVRDELGSRCPRDQPRRGSRFHPSVVRPYQGRSPCCRLTFKQGQHAPRKQWPDMLSRTERASSVVSRSLALASRTGESQRSRRRGAISRLSWS